MIGLNNIVPMMGKIANAGVAEGMVVTVKPSNISSGNNTYRLDIVADSFEVDWGDGVVDSAMAHTYADGYSEYTVQVTGANIIKLSQVAGTNDGRALTSLLRMNLPNLNDTTNMFRQAKNIYDWSNFVLPEGLTSIEYGAFMNCSSLASISLPVGLGSIGNNAFSNCSRLALTSLPAGVTSLGNNAFGGCTNLALTSLPPRVTSINAYAFWACSNLELTSLPVGLDSIGNYAFRGCSSLALTALPEGVTSIGIRAFSDCSSLALTSLPEGLTSINAYAFWACSSLADVVFLGKPNSIGAGAFGGTSANLFVPWAEGAVAGAPWGTSGTITYGYVS